MHISTRGWNESNDTNDERQNQSMVFMNRAAARISKAGQQHKTEQHLPQSERVVIAVLVGVDITPVMALLVVLVAHAFCAGEAVLEHPVRASTE